ncbi:MAG: flagellar motor protein MotB [Alphaproteobacteria bacterium]|nr:flagellar motor protein MotB [Alphaproteobacteria bacterium]
MAGGEEIIIKKIKKGGHGHHGGAWKVAYADFVTAMMAFFLLMWLLNATSSAQKSGIAEYFTPTMGLKDSKGIGFNGGLSAAPEGNSRTDKTAVGLVVGQVKQGEDANTPNVTEGKADPNATDAAQIAKAQEDVQVDKETFEQTSEEVKQALQDPEIKEYENNVMVQDTPEGLKIDMIDDPQQPMFVPGTVTLTDIGKKVLDSMARVVSKTPNNISINGHTDAPSGNINPQYTVWELSADRANASRRFLATTALEKDRVVKILGLADKELLVPNEPSNPRNKRITIVVLRDSYYRDPKEITTTRGLITTPTAKLKKPEEKPAEKPALPPGEEDDGEIGSP